jgi:hypothetical protein
MSTRHNWGDIRVDLLDELQPYRMRLEPSALGPLSCQAAITLQGPEDLISLRPLLVGYIVANLSIYDGQRNRSGLTRVGPGSKPWRRISDIYCQDRNSDYQWTL